MYFPPLVLRGLESLAWVNPSERLHWPILLISWADSFPRETGVVGLGRDGPVIHLKPSLMKPWRGVFPGPWRREVKTGGGHNLCIDL
jgi:hypothetical protein